MSRPDVPEFSFEEEEIQSDSLEAALPGAAGAGPFAGDESAMHSARIDELARLIVAYQDAYYNGEALVDDSTFDALWDELKRRAPSHPVLTAIGADASGTFPKARHIIPMGSQEKAANPDEFLSWAARQGGGPFLVQHKLDGASLELQYERGVLVRAVTRGDGIVGDDILANALKMKGCVRELGTGFSGGVRGEVLMPRSVWREKHRNKANCRNAANGLMRRKDGEGVGDLCVIVYDVADHSESGGFTREDEKAQWLKDRGFDVVKTQLVADAQAVITLRETLASAREELAYDIDGLVVKTPESDIHDLRRARPEQQIAFKFELERAISILREVVWSESGATYTPVGIVDPVRLAGTTVQRANLNNPDQIRALGLRIGLPVFVVKRGEIIPKIEGLAPGAVDAGSTISMPSSCSRCGTGLVDAGTRLYCPNTACPKRLHHRIEKWVSVLDIRDLGDQLLSRLFEAGRLSSVSDLYDLSSDDLLKIERMGEKSAAKVVASIRRRRDLSLAQFVAGFDLEGVGETIMDKVVHAGFDTLEALRRADASALSTVHGLGGILAQGIAEGMAETRVDMDRVLSSGFVAIRSPAADAPLKGCSFCFTGELRSLKRNAAKARVTALGGICKDSVGKDLNYLVSNEGPDSSTKSRKAASLGIPILDEDAFLALLAEKERHS